MTITHEPAGGGRLVRRTVDAELAKVPAHIAQVSARE
jgi:hypothetical protein